MLQILVIESKKALAKAMEEEAKSRHFETHTETCIEGGIKAFTGTKKFDAISISNPIAEHYFGIQIPDASIRFIDYLIEHDYKGLVIHYTSRNVYRGTHIHFPFILTEIIKEDKHGNDENLVGRWGYACSEII
ncbi:MAG: hypothetical protein KBC41_03680 [Candidatus Pacebacteria bacterium]|nr:hypothetical protein [Candidatus Paceibacterota bacterium]MBP9867147.1 hypothetical protein [Candidatus Paceibacterota bacterium]